MTARGKRLMLGALLASVLAAAAVMPYVTAALFLLDLAGTTDGLRALIPGAAHSVTMRDIVIPARYGPVTARLYAPPGADAPTVVVFPGIHGGGPDAPRLVRLCQRLASAGLRVVCAPLPALRQFRVTDRSTDVVEDVTRHVADDDSLTQSGRVTLVGVSFAGGLALVAAGRPELDGRLNAVASIGGHGDLARTLRFMTTGVLPDGSVRTPHDYGLAIMALTLADRLVPPDQVAAFSEAVRTFLEASLDESPGFADARRLMADLELQVQRLAEPGAGLVRAIMARDVGLVGHALAPWIGDFGANPGLSPALAPVPTVPVFLLHGRTDNVIPSTETPLTAADIERRGGGRVRWLLTPLLSHAHFLGEANPIDVWRLAAFWRELRRVM